MKYTIHIDRQAAKGLAQMPRKVQRQIDRKIGALAEDPFPRGCELIGSTTDIYRIKSGNYRIAYKVEGKRLMILVVRVGHRKEFYRYFDS